MDPRIIDSARRRGISDDAILHAYSHPIRICELDDLTMLIGGDQAGRLLEIGVVFGEAEGVDVIVHAMAARQKFLE